LESNYITWRSNENIKPLPLPNKEQYYLDLMNIEHSWSGRVDTNIGNTFIMEAEQLLVNAIELFEKGYFDCAYYSLRSAVELSTTMVFLTDLPEPDNYFKAWKSSEEFPMQSRMIKELSLNGNVFSEMREKMPEFFKSAKELSAELNKYVHKQGLRHFYVSRNHPVWGNRSFDSFIKDFTNYLDRCIGVVAVMRLAFDPFPVLLMDEEILYRCFDSMTDPYSEEFVDKYIGAATIEEYKQISMYTGTYDSFINNEKKTASVFDVMKYNVIDSDKFEEIISQFHLLPKEDCVCVLLAASSNKATKVYCYDGLAMYFITGRETNRNVKSWNGSDFVNFRKSDNPINQQYDEAYISVFEFFEKPFLIEHNELFDNDEINQIIAFVKDGIKNMAPGGDNQ